MGRLAAGKIFLDTYAILEFLKGSQTYKKRLDGSSMITTLLNLMELYYVQLRDRDEETARRSFSAFVPYKVEVGDDDAKEAMSFRLMQRSKGANISYADAVGYAVAQKRGANFLTGDIAFRDVPGVEFLP